MTSDATADRIVTIFERQNEGTRCCWLAERYVDGPKAVFVVVVWVQRLLLSVRSRADRISAQTVGRVDPIPLPATPGRLFRNMHHHTPFSSLANLAMQR